MDLIENSIDIAIRIGDLKDSSMRSVRIGTSQRVLYASKAYLKEHGRPKTVEDLNAHKLLYYTRITGGPTWSLRDRSGKTKKLAFKPFMQTDGSDFMREAVLAGFGIAMLPTWLMTKAESEKAVERLFEEASPQLSSINALSASGRDLTSKQRAFIEFLREQFEREPALAVRASGR